MADFDRITHQPEVMGGNPCIQGMSVTLPMIVGMIATGDSIQPILAAYPYLEREDVLQALRYAVCRAVDRETLLTAVQGVGPVLAVQKR